MTVDALIQNTFRDLVLANRILAREGIIDDFGHVSVRSPRDPDRFFLSRSRSPEIVDLEDIMEFTSDGDPVDQRGRRMYGERPIYAAVYAARPDVNAITHHHARAVLPFTVTSKPLRPLFHMAAVIGREMPVWDSQADFGDTNMLIDDLPKARSVAKALGSNPVVLLRGHGAICVGASIPEAVFVSIYLKENAELVLQSEPVGNQTYLTPGEIDQTRKLLLSPGPLERFWTYRVARAGFRGI